MNFVADALGRKERVKVMFLPKEFIKEVEKVGLEIKDSDQKEGRIYEMLMRLGLLERIKKSQELMIERRRSEVTGH